MKNLIKQLLKKYSYQEIAVAAGYTTAQSIRNISAGIATMPIYKQKALSKNLGVSLDKLKRAHIADIKARY